jgi:hypothetical protein
MTGAAIFPVKFFLISAPELEIIPPSISSERRDMSEAVEKFLCEGCGREMTWKPEYVGKRIKCKTCGQAMAIPAQPKGADPPPEADMSAEDLYALAEDARSAAANQEPTIVDPAAFQPVAAAAVPAAALSRSAIPLAYRRAPTAADTRRAAESSHIDKNRDVKVPLGLMTAGAVLYLAYYGIHYGLGIAPLIGISIGLIIMTILETIVLFGFGLAVAGPLSVNFGGIGTALLKFAAIAMFCDGVTTWVDGLMATWTGGIGGGGLLGFGVIGLPVALGVYWVTMTYLFSMDPGDAWLVVIILSIFYRILRVVLIILLLKLILSLGGVAASHIAIPGAGAGVTSNPVIDAVNQAKSQNLLHEARKYASDFGLTAYKSSIEGWYGAGAKNVWFETSRDINGKGDAFQLVVELPDDSTSRGKCYDVLKKYYNDMGQGYMVQSVQDSGDPYMLVPLP